METTFEVLELDVRTEEVLAPEIKHTDTVCGYKWTLRPANRAYFAAVKRSVKTSPDQVLLTNILYDDGIADRLMIASKAAITQLREAAEAAKNGDQKPEEAFESALEEVETRDTETRTALLDKVAEGRGDRNAVDIIADKQRAAQRDFATHLVVSVEGVPGYRSACEAKHIWYTGAPQCPECGGPRTSHKACKMPKSMGPNLAFNLFQHPLYGDDLWEEIDGVVADHNKEEGKALEDQAKN